jgi:hypothetical protein
LYFWGQGSGDEKAIQGSKSMNYSYTRRRYEGKIESKAERTREGGGMKQAFRQARK